MARVNKDDIRVSLGEPWSKEVEKKVLDTRDYLITSYFRDGFGVVISDDTNLAPKHEQRLRNLAKKAGVGFEINDSFLDMPIEVCIDRDKLREGKARVGEKVIKDMARQFLRYEEPMVPYVSDPNLPNAVICDLDGTLALHDGRGPFELHKCDTDLVNKPIYNLLWMLFSCGRQIVYLSGRDGSSKDMTQAWLNSNKCPTGSLFMRAPGDYRKDSIVKYELFDAHVRGAYNVQFVLDDRDQVVKMWRDLGLTCLQVAYGAF